MLKGSLFLMWAAVGVVLAAGQLHARPIQFSDDALEGVRLNGGHYDMTLNLNGEVWQNGGGHGWEFNDQVNATVSLDGTKVASYTVAGMDGQNVPFHVPINFSIDAEDQSWLQLSVSSRTSIPEETFRLDSSVLSGDFQSTGGGGLNSVPESPMSLLLATGGLVLLLGRRHLVK
jgi:hypothetical protein